jgi:outer membrane lipoprotein-sorting protein
VHRYSLAAALSLTLAAPAVWAQSADLAQVEAHLRAVSTLSANFTQTAANGAVSRGTMVLARPGRVRFDYGEGAKYLVVADGRSLNLVDYELRQVQSYPIKDTPLSLLLDPKANLQSMARVISAGPGALANVVLVEAQDRKRPEYGTITLAFVRDARAPGGLNLTGWRVLDAQGNLTAVSLSNVRVNGPVDAAAFRFKDPRPRSGGVPGKAR